MSTNAAGWQPLSFTPPPIPQMPSLPVVNPSTTPRRSFLTDMLDPSKATYIGNKFRPDLQRAGQSLRGALEGFGNYSFSEDAAGITNIDGKQTEGQPGKLYKDAYFQQRAAAAAAGMLYSRTAEEAVGTAWHRLGEQERQIITQYGGQVNGILSNMSSEFSGVVNELTGLYGQDVQYALDNPIITPDPASAGGGGGGGAGAGAGGGGGLGAADLPGGGNPMRGNPWAWGKPGNTTRAGAAPPRWTGSSAPNMQSLARAWGVPVSSIQIKRGIGNRYIAEAW